MDKDKEKIQTPNKKKMTVDLSGKYYEAVGRRKTATARVRIYESGSRKGILVNDKNFREYFEIDKLADKVEAPLKITGNQDLIISARVSGGGDNAQAEAVRHGIARALLKMDKELRPTLKPLGFLTRDPRRKERKKPGLKRARKSPQWSKR